MVPVVVRLEQAGVCGCGRIVAAGERAGTTRQPGHVVCLPCLAAFSAGPSDAAKADDTGVAQGDATPAVGDPVDGPDGPLGASDGGPVRELRAPVAVVIPADWGPPSPGSVPSWQRSAGVAGALSPAAPATATDAAPVSAPAHVAAPAAPDPAPDAAPAPTTPLVAPASSVVAVASEAVAVVTPSHRRRTLLPPGLLALRPSRGRQPGVAGHPDAATRALLEAAADSGVLSLHDRRMPGRRGRIAHLAVGAGGVFVIDVVHGKSASVEVRPVDERKPDTRELLVGGRSMASTVEATRGRVATVRALLDEVQLSAVPVVGVVCFVDATVRSDAEPEVAGVQVTGRAGLPTLVDAEGALDREHRETLLEYLTDRLPAA